MFSSNVIVIYITYFGKQRNTRNNEFPDIIAEIGESIQIHFAEACPDRKDLVSPGPDVLDDNGKVIGCHGLSVL